MSTIVTRAGKGSALTHVEVDSNFTNLNTDKIQSGNTVAALTITSATINGGTITGITDLAVADGGTGLSTLTAGYIPFGAGTSAFGSSANLFWDSTNNRLGIGTTSPNNILNIVQAGGGVNVSIQSEGSTAYVAQRSSSDTSSAGFNTRKTRGTIASPTAVSNSDGVGIIQMQAYGGSNYRNIATIASNVETYTSDTNISGNLTFTTNVGSTGTTERMRITSAGNVGIGTTSPVSRVHISNTDNPFFTAEDVGNGVGYFGQNLNLTTVSAESIIAFRTGATYGNPFSTGTERMRITSAGDVGIGTTSPATYANYSSLTVGSSASKQGLIYITDGTINYWNYVGSGVAWTGTLSNTPYAIQTNNAERMRITSAGAVGIGTTTPAYILSVNSSNGINSYDGVSGKGRFVLGDPADPSGYVGMYRSAIANIGTAGNDLTIGSYNHIGFTTGAAAFSSQTERMRIDSSGNVLVGTTSTILSNTKFNLSSSQAASLGGMGFVNTGASTKKWQIGPDGNGNFVVFNDSAAGVYVSYGGTSWTANSDERLKTDLKPIENATEKVSTIRSVTGRYKTDEEGTSRAFLIAQDVQKVLPEAVNVQNDEQGTLGVAYTEVIPLLVAAIKEQQTIINDLKARITILEGK
jgi:hypothetical protein